MLGGRGRRVQHASPLPEAEQMVQEQMGRCPWLEPLAPMEPASVYPLPTERRGSELVAAQGRLRDQNPMEPLGLCASPLPGVAQMQPG